MFSTKCLARKSLHVLVNSSSYTLIIVELTVYTPLALVYTGVTINKQMVDYGSYVIMMNSVTFE